MAEAETLDQLETRHAAERRALLFDQKKVDASKGDAETKLATCVKCAVDVTIADEVVDDQYVTISYPTDKTGAEGRMWLLLVEKIEADPGLVTSTIRDPGTIRVRKDSADAVLDAIEAALPE